MRISLSWIVVGISFAFAVQSCASDCGCELGETDFNGTVDSESDRDTAGTNPDATHGSFCNPLTLRAESVVMKLLIGTGATQVALSAGTGTCSNHLGDACTPIPTGTAVPLAVQTEDGQTLYTTELDMAPGGNYVFFTSVDSDASVILLSGLLTEAWDCANMECYRSAYNERTCDGADPCGWANNGTCDNYCAAVLPDGQTMFDDSADCVNAAP